MIGAELQELRPGIRPGFLEPCPIDVRHEEMLVHRPCNGADRDMAVLDHRCRFAHAGVERLPVPEQVREGGS